MTGEELAQAAEGLVGVRFRLHGRCADTGLDCLGVLVAAFADCGRRLVLPTGYTLRMQEPRRMDALAAAAGLMKAEDAIEAGDVLMLRVGPGQYHASIAVRAGHVHAHAGLRRVVLTPGPPAGTLLRHWRAIRG